MPVMCFVSALCVRVVVHTASPGVSLGGPTLACVCAGRHTDEFLPDMGIVSAVAPACQDVTAVYKYGDKYLGRDKPV